jgi:hypothetical protein
VLASPLLLPISPGSSSPIRRRTLPMVMPSSSAPRSRRARLPSRCPRVREGHEVAVTTHPCIGAVGDALPWPSPFWAVVTSPTWCQATARSMTASPLAASPLVVRAMSFMTPGKQIGGEISGRLRGDPLQELGRRRECPGRSTENSLTKIRSSFLSGEIEGHGTQLAAGEISGRSLGVLGSSSLSTPYGAPLITGRRKLSARS